MIARCTKDANFVYAKHVAQKFRAVRSKVHQFCVKSEVQKLRTERGVDFKSDSGSLGLYPQHIFKNQPWLLWESGETARNLDVYHSIMPFIN